MAVINLKEEKRISVNGEFDEVVTQLNNEPIFRQNGHELQFEAANSDYLSFNTPISWSTFGDVDFDYTFDLDLNNIVDFSRPFGYFIDNSNRLEVFFGSNGLLIIIIITNGTTILNTGYTITPLEKNNNFYIKNGIIVFNGVTYDLSSFINESFVGTNEFLISCRKASAPLDFSNSTFKKLSVNNEIFNPTDIDSNGQIEGSSGTVATVNTSHASGLSYILGTVFQKTSFALVGNGTTEKIVGHLGTDLILTSTPLEGGFTLDGVVYNLTEGLGNEIKSTTGETATIQGFTGTGLNFGGWQKGNSIDGWTPYTIV